MGLYEKILGVGVIPLLYILLVLLSLGFARKQMHAIIKFLLKFKLTINGVTVYLFLLITVINVIAIIFLYSELSEMQEPTELAAKTGYFEKLYRTYRNFLLNIASFVLIFQIFFAGRTYKKYAEVRDKLQEIKELNKNNKAD